MKNEKSSKNINVKTLEDILEESYSRINVPITPSLKVKDYIKLLYNTNYEETFKQLRSTLNKLTKTDRGVVIPELRQCYKNEKLVFVLGAGISMNFGLPNWDTLLQKLMIETLEKEKNASNILSKLFAEIFKPSPLIAGRYLQKYFESNNKSFEDAVRKILYQEIVRDPKSQLMNEIVRFCIAPGKSPNLNSIITYNFDDILEQSILASGLDLPFKSIYGLGIDVDTKELPIYHVHGYIPENEVLTEENKITFGENVYHKQYVDIYSWNNIVQINKFRENNCLFIGTSLTDPNIRRLLDISNQQRTSNKGSHFIVKQKYKNEEVKKALEILLNQNKELLNEKSNAKLELDETVTTLIEIIESFEENDLNSFGIKTIWIDKFAEIPVILKQIRIS